MIRRSKILCTVLLLNKRLFIFYFISSHRNFCDVNGEVLDGAFKFDNLVRKIETDESDSRSPPNEEICLRMEELKTGGRIQSKRILSM